MKKILCMFFALCITMSLAIPAFASENSLSKVDERVELQEVVYPITPYAADVPTSVHSLPYTATTSELPEGCGTYTKYYFAPSGTDINVSGTFTASKELNDQSRYAKIKLYKVGNTNPVDSYSVPQFVGSTTVNHTFSNLSKDSHYYFEFENTTPNALFKSRWIDFSLVLS